MKETIHEIGHCWCGAHHNAVDSKASHYHRLERKHARNEEREGSHGRSSTIGYERYHCDNCDYVSDEFHSSDWKDAHQRLRNAEFEHNISVIIGLLSVIAEQIS